MAFSYKHPPFSDVFGEMVKDCGKFAQDFTKKNKNPYKVKLKPAVTSVSGQKAENTKYNKAISIGFISFPQKNF